MTTETVTAVAAVVAALAGIGGLGWKWLERRDRKAEICNAVKPAGSPVMIGRLETSGEIEDGAEVLLWDWERGDPNIVLNCERRKGHAPPHHFWDDEVGGPFSWHGPNV